MAREYHARVMASRKALTTYQQQKLRRQNDLREATAAATIISSLFRGHKTRSDLRRLWKLKLKFREFLI